MARSALLSLALLPALATAAAADPPRCEEAVAAARLAAHPGRAPGVEREAGGEGARGTERTALDLRLEQILPPAAEVAGRWEIVEEVPTDPAADPDLLRWGVCAQRARHYTRAREVGAQVCSIEIWAFESEGRARLAHQNFDYPNWEFAREGRYLIMLHALTLRPGGARSHTLFPDCRSLGALASTRAEPRKAALRPAPGPPREADQSPAEQESGRGLRDHGVGDRLQIRDRR